MLDPDRLELVFTEALSRPSVQERAAYLDGVCRDEPALRQRVEELLRAHLAADRFLPLPTATLAGEAAGGSPDRPGDLIGPYKLLQLIGEGGFGTVYMAEQQHPVRRKVALKIIKLGMDTRQVIARFEAERQALAIMDHPNIARVFDAGATPAGRPYFVMELVSGVPITAYCDADSLSITQRLELFIQVCQAVQHAHQKGLIHRDIKPSNVLVANHDGRPLAKVIDFGIAKAAEARLTEKTFFTEFRQLFGTPEYMSPEQAEGSLDIDTRCDVYSLGVLLYELLTGSPPFDPKELRSKVFAEIQRIIREVDPPAPSTRLSASAELASLAARRRSEPRRLSAAVRGELDWVVMKCLEKDRARRYGSAASLAADLIHHLAYEPVEAAAPTWTYRLRKLIRRRRGVVVASLVVLCVLLAGITGTTVGLFREARQRGIAEWERGDALRQKADAETARDESDAVNLFLTGLLAEIGPHRLPDKTVRDQIVSAIIDPAAATVETRFKDKPLIEAAVRDALAMTYESVGRSDLGLPHALRALELRRRLLGDDHPVTLSSNANAGMLLMSSGRLEEAESLMREGVDRSRRALGGDDPRSLSHRNNLATLLQAQGNLNDAEPLFREVLDAWRRVGGDDHANTLMTLMNLGMLLEAQGRSDLAEPILRDCLERRRHVLSDDHPDTIMSIMNLGGVLKDLGRIRDAEALWLEGLERSVRVLGEDNPDTLRFMNHLAGIHTGRDELEEAERLFRDVLARRRRVLGDDHPDTLISIGNLALVLKRLGDLEQAERLARETLTRSLRVLKKDHPDTLIAIDSLAGVLAAKRDLTGAEDHYRDALEGRRRVLGEDHPDTLRSLNNLGMLLRHKREYERSDEMLRDALARTRRVRGDDHPDTLRLLNNIGVLLFDQLKVDRAEPIYAELFARARSAELPPAQAAMYLANYGPCLVLLRRHEEAAEPLRVAYERMKAAGLEGHGNFKVVVQCLAEVAAATNHPDDAARWRAELAVLKAGADSAAPHPPATQRTADK